MVTGPITLAEALPSFCVDEMINCSPAEIASAIVALPGARQTAEDGPPTDGAPAWEYWEAWSALWESGDEQIGFHGMDLLGEDDDEFGCILVDTDCRVETFVAIWQSLHDRFPSLWIYDQVEGCLHTPGSFREHLMQPTNDSS
jgi:hypothetical protein